VEDELLEAGVEDELLEAEEEDAEEEAEELEEASGEAEEEAAGEEEEGCPQETSNAEAIRNRICFFMEIFLFSPMKLTSQREKAKDSLRKGCKKATDFYFGGLEDQ